MATLDPTFLVKKSDGTTVRMTMAEFDAWKKSGERRDNGDRRDSGDNRDIKNNRDIGDRRDRSDNAIEEEIIIRKDALAAEVRSPKSDTESTALATTTPVSRVFVDEAAAAVHPIDIDHRSPLEEELDEPIAATSLSRLPADTKDAFAATLADLPFPIDPSLRGRATSLMQSRAKDIRSDDQFILYATKPALDGGLGLDESQARAMLGALVAHAHLSKLADIPPALPLKQKRAAVLAKEQTPMPPPRRLAPSSSALERPFSARPTMHDVVPAMAPSIHSSEPLRAAASDISAHDLGTTVSPVEELQSIRMEDFRRLGRTVADRGAAISHKFDMLRAEAFPLFIEASNAWRQSPLMAAYMNMLAESVRDGATVTDTIGAHADANALTAEEFTAIAEINKRVLG